MSVDWELVFFVVIAVLFFGSFGFGMWWNVRKGNEVLRWLREGLPLISERSTMRWIGTTVVELKMAKARDPFRNAEMLVVLDPRDVVFLWMYSRLRGRRDLLICRAQLHAAPSFEMEIIDPRAWTAHGIERSVQGKGWTRLDVGNVPRLVAYHSGASDASAAKALIASAESAGGKLVRLSVHRAVPNLEVHWLLPDVKKSSAHNWFLKLRQLGENVMSG